VSSSLARVRGEFTVTRRVPWDSDAGLRPHIDQVVDALHEYDASAEIEIDADLDEAHVRLSVVVVVGEDADAEATGRDVVGAAIRGAEGRHEGLFPEAEEARLEIRSGFRPGLKTAKWALHHLECEPFEEG
jgi:hypothetical protein